MQRKYFISYHYTTLYGDKGFKNTFITRNVPIHSMSDISEIQRELENERDYKECTIMYYHSI